ncbi:MAG: MBL fold metallo-hydrolase [Fibrobacteria bacterium]|nr:MBL fold metallo-hydrolase [Fibrobacteria bacterium]
MNIKIHRGTDEIGGSCIELQSGNSRLLLDLGMPLVDDNRLPFDKRTMNGKTIPELIKEKLLPDVPGLYDKSQKGPEAILISHPHQDHYGLLQYAREDIPVYLSRGCHALMESSRYFGQTDYQLANITPVVPWEPFQVADFTVTPYLMDHSGFDAFAWLVEAGGKRVFYSGDFRSHGRKHVLFENILSRPPENIDYLILEGTMVERQEKGCLSETDVENELVKRFRPLDELFFFACSSQNIDRIVSVYRACVKSGRMFIIDPYTARVLDSVKEISGNIPQADWGNNIGIFFIPGTHTEKMANDKSLYKFKQAKITYEYIAANRNRMVIKDSYVMRDIFKNKQNLRNSRLIYSLWNGYLEKDRKFWEHYKVPIEEIHTSGHAFVKDLQELVKAIKPAHVIPNHTFAPDKFPGLFPDSDVIQLDKGVTI